MDDDNDSKRSMLRATTIAVTVLYLLFTIPFVAIKLFTSIWVKWQFKWDDFFILVAQVLSIAWVALNLALPDEAGRVGYGTNDTSGYQEERMLESMKSNLISIIYMPTLLAAMLAMLVHLERLFVTRAGNAIWYSIRASMAACVIVYTVMFFAAIFLCTPRDKIWDNSVPGTCLSLNGSLIATGIFNILVKLLLLLLPRAVVGTLKITTKQKFTVMLYFSGTVLSLIASILRLVFSVRFAQGPAQDHDRNALILGLWSGAEVACLIFAAAFASMPTFTRWVRDGFTSDRKRPLDEAGWELPSRGGGGNGNSPRDRDGRSSSGAGSCCKKWAGRWYELDSVAAPGDDDASVISRTPSRNEIHVTRSFDVTAEERRGPYDATLHVVHGRPPREWMQGVQA